MLFGISSHSYTWTVQEICLLSIADSRIASRGFWTRSGSAVALPQINKWREVHMAARICKLYEVWASDCPVCCCYRIGDRVARNSEVDLLQEKQLYYLRIQLSMLSYTYSCPSFYACQYMINIMIYIKESQNYLGWKPRLKLKSWICLIVETKIDWSSKLIIAKQAPLAAPTGYTFQSIKVYLSSRNFYVQFFYTQSDMQRFVSLEMIVNIRYNITNNDYVQL